MHLLITNRTYHKYRNSPPILTNQTIAMFDIVVVVNDDDDDNFMHV